MLKDVLADNLTVVFCGTAKGNKSVAKGFYYAGPGNKFYGSLHHTGLTNHKLLPSECYTINKYNIGLTDLVHTQSGNDIDISDDSYDVPAFLLKMDKFKPKIIAFTSKKAASFVLGFRGVTSLVEYGLQSKLIGQSKVFVLPSTSGNARRFWDDSFWFELSNLFKAENNTAID